MTTTRLLVLGAVRIFQPVHGYLVRRELLSWRVDEWAHVNPGSIYNALRGLARDGLIEEVAVASQGERPGRTSYRLLPDGETEFLILLRDALWRVDQFSPDLLLAGVSFMGDLSRAEVIAALESRIAQIEAARRGTAFAIEGLAGDDVTPGHVVELLRLIDARGGGELEWTRQLLERVRAGRYRFSGEG